MRSPIPSWTVMDLKRAKEHANSLAGSGSTTPILEKYFIKHRYAPVGRVYVDAEELMEVFLPILGPHCPGFAPFNDLPGPHPWQAEIRLKQSFKKLLDKQPEPARLETCEPNGLSYPARSAAKIRNTVSPKKESMCFSVTST